MERGLLTRNQSRMLPQQPRSARRSTSAQSRTLFIGMDVHKETISVAYVAQEHGAEVSSLGTLGTRQCDIDQLVRKMPSKATHPLFVSEAGPCGSWLYRDAVPLARLARSGALTLVAVPNGEEEASRDLTRARADLSSALKAATFRPKACLRRQDSR